MEDPTFWELPENVGQYRDDRRNVYLDGKSNLVFHAAKDGNTYYSGKVFGKWRGGIGHNWEARIKLNCLTPGAGPPGTWPTTARSTAAKSTSWSGTATASGPPGTAVHAKLNGGEHVSQTITVDSAWHTWRVQWDDAGMRFWKDYTDGAQPYFNVPAELAAGLAVQRARLPAVSGDGPRGRGLRRRRPERRHLSRRHADRLGARLVKR